MSFFDDFKRGAEEGWDRAIDLLHGRDFLDTIEDAKENLEDDDEDEE